MERILKNTREYFNELIKDFDTWKDHLDSSELAIVEMWLSGKANTSIGLQIGCSTERIGQIIRGTNRFGKGGIIARIKQKKTLGKLNK
ncbi:hypothetical protein LGK97_17090 [Clostridium sp. CS001]|uniref:hypothetical protein n=1 Tax=Clostridium sp. CS001 TaxID=2880648 RepID=UPI001CF46C69|nr:hypothetical protein [Clostridium sp. CS001]MCB2291444.1 hypothetical protein [Clostridium sp. CS001]